METNSASKHARSGGRGDGFGLVMFVLALIAAAVLLAFD
jgi:hypothetical protein